MQTFPLFCCGPAKMLDAGGQKKTRSNRSYRTDEDGLLPRGNKRKDLEFPTTRRSAAAASLSVAQIAGRRSPPPTLTVVIGRFLPVCRHRYSSCFALILPLCCNKRRIWLRRTIMCEWTYTWLSGVSVDWGKGHFWHSTWRYCLVDTYMAKLHVWAES